MRFPAWAISLLLLALSQPASALDADRFRTRLLTAAFQSPANAHDGDGNVVASVADGEVLISGQFEGLAAPVIGIRLLSGVAVGVPGNAEIARVPFKPGAHAGQIDTRFRLNSDQLELLRAGRIYLQVETEDAPDGALWGWFLPDHPFPGENVPEKRNWQVR